MVVYNFWFSEYNGIFVSAVLHQNVINIIQNNLFQSSSSFQSGRKKTRLKGIQTAFFHISQRKCIVVALIINLACLCCLWIMFGNSLNPDQARHFDAPHLNPNYLTLMLFLK